MILSSSLTSRPELSKLISAGFTLLQTDSDHLSTDEAAPGVWDFTHADSDFKKAASLGLDWCYFPHFAFPPKWYDERVAYSRIQCLEHGLPVQAFSPWDPRFPAFVSRGYEKLREHFGKRESDYYLTSSPARPMSLYLGIHGDYGETGLLMGARTAVPGQKEEWQKRFGDLHDHLGWWCGDQSARKAFRDAMGAKYGSIDVLNAAWKTNYVKPGEIDYPVSPAGIARRRWLDFVEWYERSATGLADLVCRAAEKQFPDSLKMIPAGFPDENPHGGNDNSLIARIAARHKVDVRSTHGGFKPFAENQATMLGRIASACKFYGVPLWTEPPGKIDAAGEVGRIFTSVSMGSKGFFDWSENVREHREAYYKYGKFLKVEKPVVDVAMLFPSTSHLMRPDEGNPPAFEKGCTDIRDVLNYDILDERMVRDGALDRYRLLVMWEGTVFEAETLSKIRDWVQSGGILAAYDFGKVETVEGDRSWFTELFGYAGKLEPVTSARSIPGAPGSREEVQIDVKSLRSEWARPFGRGWTVYFPARRQLLTSYYEVLRYLTYHLTDLDSTKRDAIAEDDAWDGVYATLFTDKILYYNPTGSPITRTIVLSPAAFSDFQAVKQPEDFTHTIKIEPNGISAIYFGSPPQELLLQCEKFTDLGGLKPVAGLAFNPADGQNHVLVPVGGQISTRFECAVAGRYRVVYRALRKGAAAKAEISMDGKSIRGSTEPGVEGSGVQAETVSAGTVELGKGVHTLTLRPARGEDVRADFVVLTNDPTIAGYSFAVK